MLEDALITTLHYHRIPERSNWIFQQDNALCHTACLTKNWFAEKAIEVMEWPAQSPDINSIENLWDQIATRVSEKNPSNLAELWVAVNAEWDELETQRVETLFESMPRRCEAIFAARGGTTRYYSLFTLSWPHYSH